MYLPTALIRQWSIRLSCHQIQLQTQVHQPHPPTKLKHQQLEPNLLSTCYSILFNVIHFTNLHAICPNPQAFPLPTSTMTFRIMSIQLVLNLPLLHFPNTPNAHPGRILFLTKPLVTSIYQPMTLMYVFLPLPLALNHLLQILITTLLHSNKPKMILVGTNQAMQEEMNSIWKNHIYLRLRASSSQQACYHLQMSIQNQTLNHWSTLHKICASGGPWL